MVNARHADYLSVPVHHWKFAVTDHVIRSSLLRGWSQLVDNRFSSANHFLVPTDVERGPPGVPEVGIRFSKGFDLLGNVAKLAGPPILHHEASFTILHEKSNVRQRRRESAVDGAPIDVAQKPFRVEPLFDARVLHEFDRVVQAEKGELRNSKPYEQEKEIVGKKLLHSPIIFAKQKPANRPIKGLKTKGEQ